MRDCLPDPPTPTNRAFPRGCDSTLAMRVTWFTASRKKTSSMREEKVMLYSSRYSVSRSFTFARLRSSWYSLSVLVRKSPYKQSAKSSSPHDSACSCECNSCSTAPLNHSRSSSLMRRSRNTRALSWHHSRRREDRPSLLLWCLGFTMSTPWKTFDRSRRLNV